ncbi:MAG TPA: NFACT family protein [Pyrinomonadaceae bacterium]|nr:NFACT family protein [Pyrinomonadaceae bacterium]
MNDQTIAEIVEELRGLLLGRAWGKVFQLSRAALAIDFRTGDGRYLLIAVEPGDPRLYLTARTVRELERASMQPSGFVLGLRKQLSGASLRDLTKDTGDRVVRFEFAARDAIGDERRRFLVAQLTGRTANLFLLDEAGRIVDALRTLPQGAGQQVGELYAPPAAQGSRATVAAHERATPERAGFATLSEAFDAHYRRIERERAFDARASAHLARVRASIEKRRKLVRNLERDLAAHGDAEAHRRVGDLLLANVSTAERQGRVVRVTDYYAEDAPLVEVEVEEGRSLQEEAARRFSRYTKAKRAAQEIDARLAETRRELEVLEARRRELERIAQTRDEAALAAFEAAADEKARGAGARRHTQSNLDAASGVESARAAQQQKAAAVPGARRYRSSDGYEILVGRGARDNDHLTFRVARSTDLWLHAADYPGSHVVIRNHARERDVPHRTLIEAAQLAAHFSQAKRDAKVAVNYTQRKFVSKMKGGAPGLVRLSSFRTLLVEPGEPGERF